MAEYESERKFLKSHHLPIMDYGAPVVQLTAHLFLVRLQRTQNAVTRSIFGLPKWTNANSAQFVYGFVSPSGLPCCPYHQVHGQGCQIWSSSTPTDHRQEVITTKPSYPDIFTPILTYM